MSEQKIEQFWREATADDIAKVMRGEKVEARFRDHDSAVWRDQEYLGGYRLWRGIKPWFIDLDGVSWQIGQVYDPPEWYVNKPDPGEGYRMLEKFPPEPKQRRDWFWDKDRSVWILVGSDGDQAEDVWYRRRNYPAFPECSARCVGQDICEGHLIPFKAYVGVEIILPNGKRLKVTQSGFEVL